MKKKYRIMMETSNICNAKCVFCPNPTLTREKMVMRNEMFDLIINRIQDENIDVEKFILHLNGEPLTDKQLISRIVKLKKEFPDIPIWFTSNFSLANREIIDQLVQSGLDTITISINSVNKDQYHQIMGLELDKTLHNLDSLIKINKAYGTPINIRVSIVDTGNKEDIDKFKEMFSEVCDIRIIHLGQWIGKKTPEKLKQNGTIKNNFCGDLNNQICILSNGDYAICSFDAEGSVGLNVRDTKLLDAFYSEEYENLRKRHKENGKKGTVCENCSFSY